MGGSKSVIIGENGPSRYSAFTPFQPGSNGCGGSGGGMYEENDLSPLIQQLLTLQAGGNKSQQEKKTSWNFMNGNGYGQADVEAEAPLAGSMLPVWSHQKQTSNGFNDDQQSSDLDQWWSGYGARKTSTNGTDQLQQCYTGRSLQLGSSGSDMRAHSASTTPSIGSAAAAAAAFRARSQSNQYTMGQHSETDPRLFMNSGANLYQQPGENLGAKSPPSQLFGGATTNGHSNGASLLAAKLGANAMNGAKIQAAAATMRQQQQALQAMPAEELMELLAKASARNMPIPAAAWATPGAFAPFGWEFLPHPWFAAGLPTHGWMGARFVR